MKKYKQSEIFHSITEYEQNVFELAKHYKELAKKRFNRGDFLIKDIKESMKAKYGILKYYFDINLVSDKVSEREPSSPRVFIWQFIPSITFEIDGKKEELLKPGKAFPNLLEPLVIPKWINSLFSEKSFSKSDFQEVVSQYYALKTISETLENIEFVKYINNKLQTRSLIIHFYGQISPIKKSNLSTIYDDSLFNKIKNHFSKLKNNLKENWYILSTYDKFTDKFELLTALDQNIAIREETVKLNPINVSFRDLFHNDYLFLNNNWYKIIHNTHGWDTECILSPSLLMKDFTSINEESLYKIGWDGNATNFVDRTMYFYTKKEDSPFLRNELLISDSNLNATRTAELLSIAHLYSK